MLLGPWGPLAGGRQPELILFLCGTSSLSSAAQASILVVQAPGEEPWRHRLLPAPCSKA